MTVFEQTFEVEAADIDENGHVNNLVYLRWVQEIATSHWLAGASQKLQASVFWVILRHEIDYQSAAVLGDLVEAKTWFVPQGSLKFERHTEMRRRSDSQLLAQARTLWLPIDAQTRRPKRLNPELLALFVAKTP